VRGEAVEVGSGMEWSEVVVRRRQGGGVVTGRAEMAMTNGQRDFAAWFTLALSCSQIRKFG
jgi:hypothetical protein